MSISQPLPYQDPALPIPKRVEDLVQRMTKEQKVGQMLQLDAREGARHLINDYQVGSILHASPTTVREAQSAVKETELQIPLLVADDLIHGYSFWEGATIFPTQLGMSATWNPELVEQVGRITADEATKTGIHWTFSPVLDVARDLRWGRIGETFGEDPYLIGELASAIVRGYQGQGLDDPSAIMATAKHFAGYSETQGGRDASEADISHRKLRSWFLPPYQRVAKEGVGAFMLGYQTTDGVPITVNEWLLSDVLRGEWDYRGVLVTDWDNVGRMVWEQKVQPDYKHAAAAAVVAGNDMIMTTPGFYQGALDALEEGMITEDQLDAAVARILTLKFKLGLFEDPREPVAVVGEPHPAIGNEQNQAVNLALARESVVVLENDGLLPLQRKRMKVAVVGPLADDAQTQLGDWAGSSGQVDWMPDGHPREGITTVLDGIRKVLGSAGEVTYAEGAKIVHLEEHPDGPTHPDGQPRWPITVAEDPDEEMIDEAVRAAEDADVVVAVVGDRIELVGETRSTATLELVGGQKALLRALAATGKPMVVILMASKPLVLPKTAREASALLWVANPGQQGGLAIAEILFGESEPVGRLAVSFPEHVGQQPTYYNQIRGQHGDRYADLTFEPAYVFGEGKQFTTVEYQGAQLLDQKLGLDGTVTADVTISNTGSRPTVEIVQGYIRDMVTSASWADKELKTFQRVPLEPGETKTIQLSVPVSECTIVNAAGKRVVEPGEFELLIGKSSRDADLEALPFTVEASKAG